MDGEADPKIKSQKHEQLLVQYAGDDDALKKIKTAYETDFALYDDANLNINYIKKVYQELSSLQAKSYEQTENYTEKSINFCDLPLSILNRN